MGKTFTRRTRQNQHEPWVNPDMKMMSQQEFNGCARKKGIYESERVAKNAAAGISEREGRPYRTYKCPHCKKYHLTSNP